MKPYWGLLILIGLAAGGIGAVLVLIGHFYFSANGLSQRAYPTSMEKPVATQTVSPTLVEVHDGEKVYSFSSTALTLGQALTGNGVQLGEGDSIYPAMDTRLEERIVVSISRAIPLTVQTQNGEFAIKSSGRNVGEALARAGFAVQGLDYAIPALDSSLPVDRRIRLVRASESLQLEQRLIPYQTSYQAVADLAMETSKIIQEGQQGVTASGIRLRYEDGKRVSKQVLKDWQAKEVQHKIIGYGTQITKRILEISGGTIEYWAVIPMYATSYSPCRLGVPNKCDNTTATGAKLQRGIVAMTRTDFAKYGNSRVYVPGYGVATVADIGGGIPGKRWIDLGFSEADYESWSREVMVYLLWPPPYGSETVNP